MDDDYIFIDEDFPYSDLTDEQLTNKIKELSNRLIKMEGIEDITKCTHYSKIALSELHNRELSRQTNLYQSQVTLLQEQLKLAQSSIKESKSDSKSARKFAIWALIASALFGLLGIFDLLNYFNVYWQKDEQYDKRTYKMQEQQLLIQDSILKSVQKIHIDAQAYYLHNKSHKSKKTSDKKP